MFYHLDVDTVGNFEKLDQSSLLILKSIDFDNKNYEISYGESQKLVVKYSPENTTDKKDFSDGLFKQKPFEHHHSASSS